jgi:hypothetical protein
MQNMLTDENMDRIGKDLCGKFPTSHDGINYIPTATDYHSKWCEAIPLPDKQAETVANALITTVFCRLGCLLQILSDQSTEFDNKLMKALCEKLHISKLRTASYKPSTNSVAERIHRTLNSVMGKIVDENQTDWTYHLSFFIAAYRSAIHSSTGFSPNSLMFGREVHAPLDMLIKTPAETEHSTTDFVDTILDRFYESHWSVREQLRTTTERNKRYYDLTVRRTTYHVGDLVWYYKLRHISGRTHIWERCYSEPYRIMEIISPVNFIIRKSSQSDSFIVHIDKLKVYQGEKPNEFGTIEETNEDSNVIDDASDNETLYELCSNYADEDNDDEGNQLSDSEKNNHLTHMHRLPRLKNLHYQTILKLGRSELDDYRAN